MDDFGFEDENGLPCLYHSPVNTYLDQEKPHCYLEYLLEGDFEVDFDILRM